MRIAYDGAARAGKTTNIIKLSEKLKREVFTPDQPGERTVYFDWMKYKGGRFEGLPIRCEMVTVPGQELLAERRGLLLQEADVVVQVVDVTQATQKDLKNKIKSIHEASGFPVPRGVLVQLNKCDLSAKTPLKDLSDICKNYEPKVPCFEAIASSGKGVQETFVFAVRASLDRVRALREKGLLPDRDDMTGERLLAWLHKNEAILKGKGGAIRAQSKSSSKSSGSSSDGRLPSSSQTQGASANRRNNTPPALPNASVPQGRVWPPKIGREILDEIDFEVCQLEPAGDGSWYCSMGDDWHMYSGEDCIFPSEQAGAQALLDWARYCSSLEALLSHPRCVVLAPIKDGSSDWRLWQMVSAKRSLRDEIALLLDEEDQEVVAHHLSEMGAKLLEMEMNRRYCANLPQCTLDSIGSQSSTVQHVGFLPSPPSESQKSTKPMDEVELLTREFSTIMAKDWGDKAKLLAAFDAIAKTEPNIGVKTTAGVLAKMVKDRINRAAS